MATSAIDAPMRRVPDWVIRYWPLILGFVAMTVPTMATLGREVWSREIGAHGPIVLATGIWLIVSERSVLSARAVPGSLAVVAAMLLSAFALYVFGRAYDFISLEAAGLYIVMLAIALRLIGWRAMAGIWFPFFYLGFMVPPPGWLIDQATAPLRRFVSLVTTDGLQMFGIPITRDGVTLMVAQYQLLVEDACSGMNSLIGLTAISLFYIYLMHRASWKYSLLLVAFILPIAIAANVLRVTVLVLITYYAGDAAAQGFLHVTAGLVLFMVALLLVFALDTFLQRVLKGRLA